MTAPTRDLAPIHQLFNIGQCTEAHPRVEPLEQQEPLSPEDSLAGQLLQKRVFAKLGNPEDDLDRRIPKRGESISEPLVDEPEVLLIMGAERGLNSCSNPFNPHRILEDPLIAGFLTAINALIRAAFAATGSLERIKHRAYPLLRQPVDPFLVCYAFQGPSYFALQKVSKVNEGIQNSPDVWQILPKALHTKRVVSEVKEVDTLVTDMFLASVEGVT